MTRIPPRQPVAGLVATASVSDRAASRAAGRAPTWVTRLRGRGPRVQLATLLDLAEALGLVIELHAHPAAGLAVELWCAECGHTWSQAAAEAWACPDCGNANRDDLEPTEAEPRKDTER